MNALLISRFELMDAALAELLRRELSAEHIDVARDLIAGRQRARAVQPALIVVGAECLLPQPRATVAALRKSAPAASLVVMTSEFQRNLMLPLIIAGADAVLHYESPCLDIARAIGAAMAGDMQLGKVAAEVMLRTSVGHARGAALPPRRELSILNLVATGQSNKRIANKLGLTEGTVKAYVRRLRQRLGARDRTHAAILGVALGLVDVPAASLGSEAIERVTRLHLDTDLAEASAD